MSNRMYDQGREAFLDGLVSWSSNTIRAVLLDTSAYTVDLVNNRWLSDIPSAARISTSGPFSGKTVTGGIAGAATATFSAVTGPTCSALAIYRDTGTASTSRLIVYIDQANGLPVTPGGQDVQINWDTGANKIFKL